MLHAPEPGPQPEPVAAVGTRPAGKVSTTVICPSVEPLPKGPLLATMMEKLAVLWPGKKFPTWVLLIVRSGADTLSVALAT